ncbi:hypothetical protein ACLOJK_006775 [Asimina triloba]
MVVMGSINKPKLEEMMSSMLIARSKGDVLTTPVVAAGSKGDDDNDEDAPLGEGAALTVRRW